jgi:predicted P-loop ATPase
MTDIVPPGATPGDWAALTRAGILKDLLPVAMDPTAKVHPSSALAKQALRGKVPSQYTKNGRDIVGIPQWTALVATQSDIDMWSAEPTLGVCIQTRDVRAFDIDIEDREAAQRVVDFVRALYPDLPLRGRENSGKALLAFRCAPGEDLPYRRITAVGGVIELLSSGKQFVAVGTHTSGVRYQWEHGTPERFPELSLPDLDALWEALFGAFADPSLPQHHGRTTSAPTKRRRGADAIEDSVLDFLFEHGHVLEHRADGGVDIACPFEAHHTAGDAPSATTYFPAGVGVFDTVHFRCLHAHCAGRSDDAFLFALGYVAEQFAQLPDASTEGAPALPSPEPPPDAPPRFARDDKGHILHTVNNAIIALRSRAVCSASFSYDTFRQAELIAEGDAPPRELTDTDVLRKWAELERFGFKPATSERTVAKALSMVVRESTFDAAMDWAKALKWDGKPRVDEAISRYLGFDYDVAQTHGVELTEEQLKAYGRAVGRYLFTALAGRCLEPGCKADMAVILVGEQGTGKTSSVKGLVPWTDAYTEVDLAHMGADAGRKMRGKMVVELAELRGLAGKEAEAVKAWLSENEDRWVPKFQERAIMVPRRCVAIGTTNETDMLHDRTGSRRFLPVPVGPADLASLVKDRDQLWAEGIVLWRKHGVLWYEAQELAKGLSHAYVSEGTTNDPWEDAARAFAQAQLEAAATGGVLLGDFLESALNMARKDQTKSAQQRAGRALRAAGFRKRRAGPTNDRQYFWFLEVDIEQYLV